MFYSVIPVKTIGNNTIIFTHSGISSKIFHQYRRHFRKICGTSGPCDMLVVCSCQHRMHSMSHLMEQIVYHARGQEAWIWPAWCWQIQHQDHNRVLHKWWQTVSNAEEEDSEFIGNLEAYTLNVVFKVKMRIFWHAILFPHLWNRHSFVNEGNIKCPPLFAAHVRQWWIVTEVERIWKNSWSNHTSIQTFLWRS